MLLCSRKIIFYGSEIGEYVGIVFSNDTLANDDIVKLTEVVRIAIVGVKVVVIVTVLVVIGQKRCNNVSSK